MGKKSIAALILLAVLTWMMLCYNALADISKTREEIAEITQYSDDIPEEIVIEDEEEVMDSVITHIVTITNYNPVPAQTNGNPLITADLSKIDTVKLKSGELRWCAVSRNLLKEGGIGYGDKILVESDDPKISGEWEVHDTMHKRYIDYVDLLYPTTKKGGKWKNIKITVIKKEG